MPRHKMEAVSVIGQVEKVWLEIDAVSKLVVLFFDSPFFLDLYHRSYDCFAPAIQRLFGEVFHLQFQVDLVDRREVEVKEFVLLLSLLNSSSRHTVAYISQRQAFLLGFDRTLAFHDLRDVLLVLVQRLVLDIIVLLDVGVETILDFILRPSR